MNLSRRLFLTGVGVLGTLVAGRAMAGVWNPCHAGLPAALAAHPLVTAAWEGVDPHRFWDCHAHIAGTGDSGSGIVLSAGMTSLLHPLQYAQRLFYMNAGCADVAPGEVDARYMQRMRELLTGLRPGTKLMLFAFDRAHDEAGESLPERSAFFVPNDYARSLALRFPDAFEWVASIHPYRRDAVAELERVHAGGARGVKWLPPAMGMDPASARCQPFHEAMARLDMPLITHGGEEKAVHGVGRPEFGNPLRLRRALDAGVRVIIAHCASIGEDVDSDHGGRRVASFSLFSRMMDDPAHRDRLFGDLSAITLRNRDPAVVRVILERDDWHGRLLNGSDYPLPGILPLISPDRFVRAGLLAAEVVSVVRDLQTYNPLLSDFVLKRHLHAGGRRFHPGVFATRDFFVASRG